MTFRPFGRGPIEVLKQGGRAAELMSDVYLTLAWSIGGALLVFTMYGCAFLWDARAPAVMYFRGHPRHLYMLALAPSILALLSFVYVVARNMYDPNFQPLSKPIARRRPLWPWSGLLRGLFGMQRNWSFYGEEDDDGEEEGDDDW